MNNYSKIEQILLKQGKFHISLELDRITKILSLLDNPHKKIRIIHVAGTNGKGSVCAMLNKILINQGYTVGLYTSPHLVKYNERIKINDTPISDEDFFCLTEKIENLAKINKIHLTEFEILTAVMFLHFATKKADIAVVEVGLGGRFDATNVVNPLISVITSISLDHTERLGDTIEKIAFEKSGIIKPKTPVIFDKNNLGANVLSKIANDNNATIFYPNKTTINFDGKNNFIFYNDKKYKFNLLGKYQEQNSSLVLKSVEVLNELGIKVDNKAIETGLNSVKWSCRFEYIKDKNIILDGCHNPDGAKVLKEGLDYYFPEQKRIFVYTSLKNKDFSTIQKNLFQKNDTVYYLDLKTDNFIKSSDIKTPHKTIEIKDLKLLIENKKQEDLLIICGSLYALGNVLGKINLCS